jgi:hypothetical protein
MTATEKGSEWRNVVIGRRADSCCQLKHCRDRHRQPFTITGVAVVSRFWTTLETFLHCVSCKRIYTPPCGAEGWMLLRRCRFVAFLGRGNRQSALLLPAQDVLTNILGPTPRARRTGVRRAEAITDI